MPSEIEIVQDVFVQAGNAEPRQDTLEIVPVQHVELAEWNTAAAYLIHRRLIFGTPGIREGKRVESEAARLENGLSLARDAAAPIHQRPEHVEEQRLDGHQCPTPVSASSCCRSLVPSISRSAARR